MVHKKRLTAPPTPTNTKTDPLPPPPAGEAVVVGRSLHRHPTQQVVACVELTLYVYFTYAWKIIATQTADV